MSREMKQSGVPWIGEIPKTWEIRKVKDVFVRKNEKAHQDYPVILSLARAGVKVRDVSTNEGQMAESYYDYNPVEPFDLLVNPMDLYSGANCSMSLVSGVISPAYVNLRAKGGACSRFYDYYFKTQYWSMAFFAHGKGISFDNRWTLGVDTLFRYNVPFPSVLEQQKIASFLDKKCSEIDEMIALQEKIVEELKAYKQSVITEAVTKGLNPDVPMKDSGIEWIGEIPDDWGVMKFHRICSVITDFVASGSFESLRVNVPYLDSPDYAMLVRTVDLSCKGRSSEKVYISKHSYDFLRNSNLFGGEVVLPNIGASVGDVYIVPTLYERMSLAPNSIMFKTNFNDKFFYYYFYSLVGKQSIYNIAQSTAQPKFNKTELRELRVCCPPLTIQDKIVNYLDNKCTEIDNLISIKLSKIDSLKEYKKSIIYEYVTGKKEVKE